MPDLIELRSNLELFKGLQAMLMILPQGDSFNMLKNRIKCVSYMGDIEATHFRKPAGPPLAEPKETGSDINDEFETLYFSLKEQEDQA